MIRVFLPLLLTLLLCSGLHAQEITFASSTTMQASQGDFVKAPTVPYYGSARRRTPGTIGMIVGGSIIVVSAIGLAATANENSGEGQGYQFVFFAIGGGIGVPVLAISGLIFTFNKIFPGRRFSVHSTHSTTGIAYNF